MRGNYFILSTSESSWYCLHFVDFVFQEGYRREDSEEDNINTGLVNHIRFISAIRENFSSL